MIRKINLLYGPPLSIVHLASRSARCQRQICLQSIPLQYIVQLQLKKVPLCDRHQHMFLSLRSCAYCQLISNACLHKFDMNSVKVWSCNSLHRNAKELVIHDTRQSKIIAEWCQNVNYCKGWIAGHVPRAPVRARARRAICLLLTPIKCKSSILC